MAQRSLVLPSICALCAAVLLAGQVDAWGTETAWTRATWPALKLRFPVKVLRQTDLEDFRLHSLNGPYGTAYYEALKAQQPGSTLVGQGAAVVPGSPAARENALRCSICDILFPSVWEKALHLTHSNGVVPTRREVVQLLSSACKTEIPKMMGAIRAVSQQLAQILADAGAGAILEDARGEGMDTPAPYIPTKVQESCYAMLEAADGSIENSNQVQAILRGLRQYVAQLNSHHVRRVPTDSFDEYPDTTICRDFNSECPKWAAKGECQKNPNYMQGGSHGEDQEGYKGHCRFSCGVCLAPLSSGELPKADPAGSTSSRWLKEVQFKACNASGVCDGVDPGILPKITTIRLDTDNQITFREWLDSSLGGAPSPAAQGQAAIEDLSEMRARAALLPTDDCFYVNRGWWTYELCHERHARQFHLEVETMRLEPVIVLGSFDPDVQPQDTDMRFFEQTSLPDTVPSDTPYMRQLYTNGSPCVLEDDQEVPRQTEVRLACSPDSDTHLYVLEPEQCQYILMLFHPTLCAHKGPDMQLDLDSEAINIVHVEL